MPPPAPTPRSVQPPLAHRTCTPCAAPRAAVAHLLHASPPPPPAMHTHSPRVQSHAAHTRPEADKGSGAAPHSPGLGSVTAPPNGAPGIPLHSWTPPALGIPPVPWTPSGSGGIPYFWGPPCTGISLSRGDPPAFLGTPPSSGDPSILGTPPPALGMFFTAGEPLGTGDPLCSRLPSETVDPSVFLPPPPRHWGYTGLRETPYFLATLWHLGPLPAPGDEQRDPRGWLRPQGRGSPRGLRSSGLALPAAGWGGAAGGALSPSPYRRRDAGTPREVRFSRRQ